MKPSERGSSRFGEYYRLAKPGIVYGNALPAIAAFLYASRWQAWTLGGWGSATGLFFATLFGISFVIASACVFNNWLDKELDARMERTRQRPLVTGSISIRAALGFGSALGLFGLALLFFLANPLTAAVSLFGWVSYVFVYGWAKRRGWWGALVGSIPGAVPIVVGYAAVTGRVDTAALLLFLTMVVWQMPHFYAIAMFRKDEYAAAGIPTLAGVKGLRAAKNQSYFFMCAFFLISPLLFVLDYAGYAYGVLMLFVSSAWLWHGIHADRRKDDAKWGRSVFLSSLLVLLAFCVILAVSPALP